jgi:hypothetical protein
MKEQAEVIPFDRNRKGLGYEPPPTNNWVAELPKGTRFLARLVSDAGHTLDEFVVIMTGKVLPAILLAKNMGQGGEFKWYDSERFSQSYKFYLTLEVVNTDGNSDQIPTGSVEGDDQSQVQPEVHEGE